MNWVHVLQRFARPAVDGAARCESCGRAIDDSHGHLLTLASRRTLCVCPACEQRVEPTQRRIPRGIIALPDFELGDAQWRALLIPIDLAFFFESSPDGRIVVMYPGPAGLVEAPLDAASWRLLVAANPVLKTMQPDVQALLVHRIGSRRDHWLAPIDRCFELAGLMRTQWHGFSGGADVWRAIDGFFDRLNTRTVHA